jgi:hypothetical protein
VRPEVSDLANHHLAVEDTQPLDPVDLLAVHGDDLDQLIRG